MGSSMRDVHAQPILASEISVIAPVAKWCECLHGCAPFREALGELSKALGAAAAAVCRVPVTGGQSFGAVLYDSADEAGQRKLERSYAQLVLGTYLDKAKPGLIWYKSMTDQGTGTALEAFHAARRLAELAVIPLSSNGKSADFLELHFTARPGANQQALLNLISATLVQTWRNRAPGLYMQACRAKHRGNSAADRQLPLLSMENPAQLSRAEYRVCVLLSNGQQPERVQKKLGISKSTLRTHLRNIYAKTGARNQSELVYLLVSMEAFTGDRPEHGQVA